MMDVVIVISVTSVLIWWSIKSKMQKKTVIDHKICELTDRLHEHKTAVIEVSLFIRQIETMKWNDYKDFRFSFGTGDSNFTRNFQSYFNGMSHKKHLRQIKAFAYDYLEDESLKYKQTLEELHKYFYKINSKETPVMQVENILKKEEIKLDKTVNDFDITDNEADQVDNNGKAVEKEIEVLQVE